MKKVSEKRMAKIFTELMDELNTIPVGDLLWLENFRERAIVMLRQTFGDDSEYIDEVNDVVDQLRKPFSRGLRKQEPPQSFVN